MNVIAIVLLSLGVAANAGLFVWQLQSAPKTSITAYSSIKHVMRTPGGLLEVSTVKSEERYDSTTNHTVLGIPVGRTVSQIRVPAVYRYHIPLAANWDITQSGNALVVIAPAARPSLPVAIDTAKLESFSSGAWSLITGRDSVAALQKTITNILEKKASSAEMILLQRESARHTVSEFVQKWVVQDSKWKGQKPPTIFVFFEDEPLGKRATPMLQESH